VAGGLGAAAVADTLIAISLSFYLRREQEDVNLWVTLVRVFFAQLKLSCSFSLIDAFKPLLTE
jgi:hypothetical protein